MQKQGCPLQKENSATFYKNNKLLLFLNGIEPRAATVSRSSCDSSLRCHFWTNCAKLIYGSVVWKSVKIIEIDGYIYRSSPNEQPIRHYQRVALPRISSRHLSGGHETNVFERLHCTLRPFWSDWRDHLSRTLPVEDDSENGTYSSWNIVRSQKQ